MNRRPIGRAARAPALRMAPRRRTRDRTRLRRATRPIVNRPRPLPATARQQAMRPNPRRRKMHPPGGPRAAERLQITRRSTESAQGGKSSRSAIHRQQIAQAAAVANQSATDASTNATQQAPTVDLLSGSPQSIANARAAAARLKAAANTAKTPTVGKAGQAAAANVALDQTTDPNQAIVDPVAAGTPATDVATAASSIVLATATNVPTVSASTGAKARGPAASGLRGANVDSGANASDAADQVQTAESAAAVLAADSASSASGSIQSTAPARSSAANSSRAIQRIRRRNRLRMSPIRSQRESRAWPLARSLNPRLREVRAIRRIRRTSLRRRPSHRPRRRHQLPAQIPRISR